MLFLPDPRGPYTQTKRGLETGDKITRHKWLVGKPMGDQIYVHRNYAHLVIPADWLRLLADTAAAINFQFRCVMCNSKKNEIRGDSAEDFDTAREPHPGWQLTVRRNGTWTMSNKPSMTIWHHKWLWVMDGYAGFDVAESVRWSQTFSPLLDEPPKCTDRTFNEQLRKVGLA